MNKKGKSFRSNGTCKNGRVSCIEITEISTAGRNHLLFISSVFPPLSDTIAESMRAHRCAWKYRSDQICRRDFHIADSLSILSFCNSIYWYHLTMSICHRVYEMRMLIKLTELSAIRTNEQNAFRNFYQTSGAWSSMTSFLAKVWLDLGVRNWIFSVTLLLTFDCTFFVNVDIFLMHNIFFKKEETPASKSSVWTIFSLFLRVFVRGQIRRS